MALPTQYDASQVVGVTWATVLFPAQGSFATIPNLHDFDPQDAATYPAGWVPKGLTSRESLPTPTADGGDSTALHTAEISNVESVDAVRTLGLNFTMHSFNKESLQMAYGGGDPATLYTIGEKGKQVLAQAITSADSSIETSVLAIYYGNGKKYGMYYPRVKVSSKTFAEVSNQALASIPFTGQVLAPTTANLTELKKTIPNVKGAPEAFLIPPVGAVVAAG